MSGKVGHFFPFLKRAKEVETLPITSPRLTRNTTMAHPFIDNMLSSLSASSWEWSSKQEQELLEPYTYVSSIPGKGVRAKLIHALNHWLNVPSSQLQGIIRVVDLLHNASLLVDDIEDGSDLRRGNPAAHMIYGVPQTINSANYVYFLAYQEVFKLPYADKERPRSFSNVFPFWNPFNPSLRFAQILNEEMLALHRGQGQEMLWRDHLRCPSEEEYVQMVKDKTGGLLRIAVKLMMECATTNTNVNYVPLVDLIGIWFQIRDDYMNLESSTYSEHKGFAEDLTEGKFSFPVIHGIRERPESNYILNVLHQKPKNPILKQHLIDYLRDSTHSFDYTLSVLHSLEGQARSELSRLGGNKMLGAILDKLSTTSPSS